MILTYMENLPDEIKNIVWEYIPLVTKAFVTKENYLKYHNLMFSSSLQKDSYIRDMIKRDNDFVFNQLMNDYYYRWIKIKNYLYNNSIYLNYIYFIRDYCVEQESTKCKNVVDHYFEINGISKNQHKKNSKRDISRRWKI
jgi:hypothetical protein